MSKLLRSQTRKRMNCNHLQDASLDHDFHPIWRHPGDLVDCIFEYGSRLIGVQLQIVNFACVFYLNV